jgi:virginiamycin A acetyltransferase
MRLLPSKFVKVHPPDGLCESVFISRLYKSCHSRRVAMWCLQRALKCESAFFSLTARTIMRERLGVEIGAYSYGSCFDPGSFGAGTTVGRYVSIARRVRAHQANHPLDRLSTHAFFFNSDLGYMRETNVPSTLLTIEHDAWIGESVVITPGCRRIGLGAVVGAGSIVTKDVPDFAVVAGNPARLIKWRFLPEMQECIRNSKWWEFPITECARNIDFMSLPLRTDAYSHPILKNRGLSDLSNH